MEMNRMDRIFDPIPCLHEGVQEPAPIKVWGLTETLP